MFESFKATQVLIGVLVSVLAISSANAREGGGGVDTSGGGGGVLSNGAVYLLDLYEAGLHLDPYFETVEREKELESALVEANLPKDTSLDLLARKIHDFEVVDPYMAATVFEAIKLLSWRLVEHPLERSDDFDQEKIDVLQLANRSGSVVLVQKQHWALMDAKNRVALVVHEALAALQPIESHKNQGPLRRLVSFLFEKKYYDGMYSHGQQALSGFPSTEEAIKRYQNQLPWLIQRNATRVRVVDSGGGQFSLRKGADFVLTPRAELQWSDRRSVMEKLRGVPNNEIDSLTIVKNVFEFPFSQFCEPKRQGFQLETLSVRYFRVKVALTSYQEGGITYPMLNWAVVPVTSVSIQFDSRDARTKANCTPQNRRQLDVIKAWSSWVNGT